MKTSHLKLKSWTPLLFLISTWLPAFLNVQADENPPSVEKPVTPFAVTQPAMNQNRHQEGIILNFKSAPIADVLNYLSEAAGFVVVQETPVTGTISVVSLQPINADEAVDLLNAVLSEKGYVAIRSERILKIVTRKNAPKKDIPVQMGNDPSRIPKKDGVVTQIIPVRYTDATRLIENIRPLLADEANLSSNESSNAIILTDTQTNIRRITEIIQALDTSIAEEGDVQVFKLQNADANDLAKILNDLYSQTAATGTASQGESPFQRIFNQAAGGGGGGGTRTNRNRSSSRESQRASLQKKVNAVGDPRTNSLIVTASRDTMSHVAEMIGRLDATADKKQKVFVYPLEYADVNNVAAVLRGIFGKTGASGGQSSATTQAQEAAGNRLNQRSAAGAASQGNQNQNTRRQAAP